MNAATIHPSLRSAARIALRAFKVHPRRVRHIADRHHDVFRVDTAQQPFVLRIQSDVLSDAEAISQLMWLESLAADTTIAVPRPIRTTSGDSFVRLNVGGTLRRAVLLTWIPGRISRSRADGVYRATAHMIARMHLYAETYRAPRGFACRTLDADWLFGERFFLRHPRAKLNRGARRITARAERIVRDAMKSAGRGAKQFGVIHADLNPGNIIFHRGVPSPIDFDEFGRGWYLFDLAELFRTSVNSDNFAARKQLAIDSYRKVRPLGDADEARFDAFMIATFLQYLNWCFAHARDANDLRWVDFCLGVMQRIGESCVK